MSLNEFKAWLEGFEASFANGVPTAEQWAAVKAKLVKVEIIKVPAATVYQGFRDPFSPRWSDDQTVPLVAR